MRAWVTITNIGCIILISLSHLGKAFHWFAPTHINSAADQKSIKKIPLHKCIIFEDEKMGWRSSENHRMFRKKMTLDSMKGGGSLIATMKATEFADKEETGKKGKVEMEEEKTKTEEESIIEDETTIGNQDNSTKQRNEAWKETEDSSISSISSSNFPSTPPPSSSSSSSSSSTSSSSSSSSRYGTSPPRRPQQENSSNRSFLLLLQLTLRLYSNSRGSIIDGSMGGDYGFDPLGICKTQEKLVRMREIELKHSRLAMLAVLGWPAAEIFHGPLVSLVESLSFPEIASVVDNTSPPLPLPPLPPLPTLPTPTDYNSNNININNINNINNNIIPIPSLELDFDTANQFDSKLDHTNLDLNLDVSLNMNSDFVPTVLNGGLLKGPNAAGLGIFFLAVSILEYVGFSNRRNLTKRRRRDPGDFGFDPLNLYEMKGTSPQSKREMQAIEVDNGRVAMLAISIFTLMELNTGKPVVDITPWLFHPIWENYK